MVVNGELGVALFTTGTLVWDEAESPVCADGGFPDTAEGGAGGRFIVQKRKPPPIRATATRSVNQAIQVLDARGTAGTGTTSLTTLAGAYAGRNGAGVSS